MTRADLDIYDTTLRDGTQREGISLSVEDKLAILRLLDGLGVAFIEAGWPGSNPKDAELFARLREVPLAHATLAAFGATCRPGLVPDEDAGLVALADAGAPVCTLFGKSWRLHVTDVLRTTADENLRMIEKSVAFVRGRGRRVVYDAEHFFDGWRDDAGFALETLRAAVRGGAEVLALCDTNGGSLPWQIEEAVRAASAALAGFSLGIHAHDDGGCAVANTLVAVRAGVRHVQGTLNGYGERCGNANLCAVMPNLELKLRLRCLPDGALECLSEVSRAVAERANLGVDEHQAYVGRSAFAHKGGVHVAAMRRNPASYQHVDPARVGNASRIVVSELAGRATIEDKAEALGVAVDGDVARDLVQHIQAEEARGTSFEAAEASVALLVRRQAPGYQAPFQLVDYKVLVGQRPDQAPYADAAVQIAVGGEVLHTAAVGNGPVSALDAALRKALVAAYPRVARIQLVDYKVRILDGRDGTSAVTRVLVDCTDGERRWSTVGASSNILAASWRALSDGIEYGMSLQ
jgi:2-isopropylmalate synthase